MNVCPKCHNQIVYGMNCCTGRRVLNIMPPDPLSPGLPKPCGICGTTGWDHDQWKHDIQARVEKLEKEAAARKGEGAALKDEGGMSAQSPMTKLLLRRALSQCYGCFQDSGIYGRTFTCYTCDRCGQSGLHVGTEIPSGCPDCMREAGACTICGKKVE
jgi:hypothetical protein